MEVASFPGQYATNLCVHGDRLAVSVTDGNVYSVGAARNAVESVAEKAHPNRVIHGLVDIDAHTVGTCGQDGVKAWDVRIRNNMRPVVHLSSASATLCVGWDADTGLVAAGGELHDGDATVVVWDVRTQTPLVRYVDSHHDDVTSVGVRRGGQCVVSGSVDGLVNLFDVRVADEDDAVAQAYNHGASVAQAGFSADNVVYARSHMETLTFYRVAEVDGDGDAGADRGADTMDTDKTDTDKTATDKTDTDTDTLKDYGDVRTKWSCDYIVRVMDDYVAVGSHGGGAKLYPMTRGCKVKPHSRRVVDLAGGHAGEVIRDVVVHPRARLVFTCGEDGQVKRWDLGTARSKPKRFAPYVI